MIIVDKALQERAAQGRPIRVGMVGAGFMGRGVVLQVATAVPGIRILAVANRHLDQAERAYREAGFAEAHAVETAQALAKVIARGEPAITEDWRLLCESPDIEAILEVTGSIDYAANVAVSAIDHGKHVILMSAELDGTVGPVLKHRADRAGVMYTGVDGDQPGVTVNLYRFVRGLGITPVVCGNIKGLHDPYRNPTTQEDFAKKWGQKPSMVTSFADGTKVSFEQAIIANATGMRVARRGMLGPTVPSGTPIDVAAKELDAERFVGGPGIVDYVTGAMPGPGVFVLGTIAHPQQRHYLNLYKLGEGPLYCFYTPYHLCHFEVPNTIARAVLFGDAAIQPLAGPCVDVLAAAKTDLTAGTVLDDLGCYNLYGLAENAEVVARERLLPLGIAPGCRLKRDLAKDTVLSYADVEVPAGRLIDTLRAEQDAMFAPTPLAAAIAG